MADPQHETAGGKTPLSMVVQSIEWRLREEEEALAHQLNRVQGLHPDSAQRAEVLQECAEIAESLRHYRTNLADLTAAAEAPDDATALARLRASARLWDRFTEEERVHPRAAAEARIRAMLAQWGQALGRCEACDHVCSREEAVLSVPDPMHPEAHAYNCPRCGGTMKWPEDV